MRSIILAAAALTAIVAFLSLGCGGKGQYYHVILDPAFTPEDQEAAIHAADAWMAAAPVWLTVTIGTCSGKHDGEICTHRADHAWFVANVNAMATGTDRGGVDSSVDGGEVWIDSDYTERKPEHAQELFGHEFGHALGLQHTSEGMMVPGIGDPGDSPTPTCIDVTQFYQVRGWPTAKACAQLDTPGE